MGHETQKRPLRKIKSISVQRKWTYLNMKYGNATQICSRKIKSISVHPYLLVSA
jgi:hypothetical protein